MCVHKLSSDTKEVKNEPHLEQKLYKLYKKHTVYNKRTFMPTGFTVGQMKIDRRVLYYTLFYVACKKRLGAGLLVVMI